MCLKFCGVTIIVFFVGLSFAVEPSNRGPAVKHWNCDCNNTTELFEVLMNLTKSEENWKLILDDEPIFCEGGIESVAQAIRRCENSNSPAELVIKNDEIPKDESFMPTHIAARLIIMAIGFIILICIYVAEILVCPPRPTSAVSNLASI